MAKTIINFNDKSYSIDESALSTVKNAFISHLGTIAGSGAKVVIGGVVYNVDATKLNDAAASLEAVLNSLGGSAGGEGGLEPITWDGVVGDRVSVVDGGLTIVKMSDKIFTEDELIGSTATLTNDTEASEVVLSNGMLSSFDGAILALDGLLISASSTDPGIGVVLPETGTYFALMNGLYISSLTFPS